MYCVHLMHVNVEIYRERGKGKQFNSYLCTFVLAIPVYGERNRGETGRVAYCVRPMRFIKILPSRPLICDLKWLEIFNGIFSIGSFTLRIFGHLLSSKARGLNDLVT